MQKKSSVSAMLLLLVAHAHAYHMASAPSYTMARVASTRAIASPTASLTSSEQQQQLVTITTVPGKQQQGKEQQQQQQCSERRLDAFLSQFSGHFDNHAQVLANEAEGLFPREGGGHEHIHCMLTPFEIADDDDAPTATRRHVLATYYFNGNPFAVFRERLYGFDELSDDPQFGACVRMSIYKIRPETAAQLRAATAAGRRVDEVEFTASDLSDELRIPEADVFWRWCGERYEGEMRTESITLVSERDPTQLLRITDDVAFWGDALWVNDRGSDAESGEYVYGNIHSVPYKMSRVPEEHWTSTGERFL